MNISGGGESQQAEAEEEHRFWVIEPFVQSNIKKNKNIENIECQPQSKFMWSIEFGCDSIS